VLDRLDERVLDGVGSQAYVADARGQRGRDPGRLLPVDPIELRRVQVTRR
jgi:hypothetical protein